MGLILLEAFAALAVLVLIVWWTMFSGRRRGELHDAAPTEAPSTGEAAPEASDDGRPPRG